MDFRIFIDGVHVLSLSQQQALSRRSRYLKMQLTVAFKVHDRAFVRVEAAEQGREFFRWDRQIPQSIFVRQYALDRVARSFPLRAKR